jgi:fructose-1,6-bisphosphatase
MQDNYQTCVAKMEQFEDFSHYGNNMTGVLYSVYSARIQLLKVYEYNYLIYSYSTLICFVNFRDRTYCINPTRYSATTSKQVSYIRRAVKVWERKGYQRILWI